MISDERDIAKAIGQTIAKYRKAKGLSQEKMAELMGLSNDAISRMERGTITLNIVRLYQFADILGCRAADLLTASAVRPEDNAHRLVTLLQHLSHQEQQHFIQLAEQLIQWKTAS